MGLTAVEKRAGRQFRDERTAWLSELNRVDPATYQPPVFIGIYRHLCPARNNRSTAMELKERYVTSPQYVEGGLLVAAGRFGYLYREGQCRACGQTARSGVGRLVDAFVRPPLTGRTRS